MRILAALLVAAAGAPGCGGGDTGGAGGSGGATQTTGTGGAGGAGGGGGGASPCLDASAFGALFTVADDTLCAIATYAADVELGPAVPTWGRHGGPLVVRRGEAEGSVELLRLAPATTGKLDVATTSIEVALPGEEQAFLGSQAVDLPFFGWTAIGYSGSYPQTQGEVVLLQGESVGPRYPVNAYFSAAGLSAEEGKGRLLFTALSGLEDEQAMVNGLYSADTCGSDGAPRLVPDGDESCAYSQIVANWGDASGPVAVDREGNAFAVMTKLSGEQEARGFAASSVDHNSPPDEGTPLFELPGFGMSMATVSTGSGAGIVVFQPFDPESFAPLDVVAQRYTASAEAVKAEGDPQALLEVADPAPSLVLFTDDQDRLWVGGPNPDGGSLFVVLDETP